MFEFHEEAEDEFFEAIAWYLTNAPDGIAGQFNQIVYDIIQIISDSPGIYQLREHGARQAVVSGFPYSIVYLDFEDHVYIVALAHVKRRPGYWKHRLEFE